MTARLDALHNASLAEAMRYSLEAGGKRLRPLLLLATVDTFGGDVDTALPAAAALEYLHTYSLIHDDLPAMDNDDLRRGQPTSHKQFGEAMAILAGDALQAEAFAMLSMTEAPAATVVTLTQQFAQAVGANGMVAGQVMDMTSENQLIDVAHLRLLQALKTGALIEVAVMMGATLADVGEQDAVALRRFAQAFGLAFQIQDDINDVTKTSAALGKTANKDVAENKATFPAILGLPGARKALATQLMLAREAVGHLSVPAPQLQAFLSYFD
nr:farnesyl diphosphate synthase [Lacticaseibacillus daqingensis]